MSEPRVQPGVSPFPGMDPYMERRWRDVHASLMPYARDALQPQLPDDLIARIEESVQLDLSGEEAGRRNPDVSVVETPGAQGGWSGRAPAPAGSAAAVDEPVLLEPDEDLLTERHIEITSADGSRVVTAVEFLSPWNKLEGSGRERYLRKREQYLASRASLVEVDLVRAGVWWRMLPGYRVPPEHRSTYRATVKRAGEGTALELYRIWLDRRLPTVRIPLRPGEADVSLELQPLIDTVYRNGRFDRTDYSKPLDPPLEGEELAWAAVVLKAAGQG